MPKTEAKILVVDDEESLRFTLQSFLEDDGYLVSTAETFAEAKQLIAISLNCMLDIFCSQQGRSPQFIA